MSGFKEQFNVCTSSPLPCTPWRLKYAGVAHLMSIGGAPFTSGTWQLGPDAAGGTVEQHPRDSSMKMRAHRDSWQRGGIRISRAVRMLWDPMFEFCPLAACYGIEMFRVLFLFLWFRVMSCMLGFKKVSGQKYRTWLDFCPMPFLGVECLASSFCAPLIKLKPKQYSKYL